MSAALEDVMLVILQAGVAMALAPLLVGITRRVKSRLQYRRGPSLLQPYRDLAKWWSKETVQADAASVVSAAAPIVTLGAMVVAVLLVPLLSVDVPLGLAGDLLVVIGLLALARFAMALGALDAGSAFGGMGASREVAIASLVEPGLVLSLAVGVAAAASTDLGVIARHGLEGGGLALGPGAVIGAAAFVIVLVAESGHEPVDNPDTHLELTMIHEGMLLEASGRRLAMLTFAAELKLVVLVGLFSAVFLPVGLATSLGPGALAVGFAALVAKLVGAAVLLGLLDGVLPKRRILALPSLLGLATLLAVTALSAQLWLAT